MDEPCSGTASYTVSACVSLTVSGRFSSVNELEEAIVSATRQAGRDLYASAFRDLQEQWLERRSSRFAAQRWRSRQWITPFGAAQIPARVVREKATGKYLTLSKALLGRKATGLLSPLMEKRSCEEAAQQNFRPAARCLSGWIGAKVSPWLVWASVQFHGARHLLQLERNPPGPARPRPVEALVSEMDSTWLKAQQRRRSGPVKRFPVHLGLHYTGRAKRHRRRASGASILREKETLVSMEPMAIFARKLQLRGEQLFRPKHHILISDGDEGIERQREKFFPQALWLLDRWHIAQQVRGLTGPNRREFRRLMRPIWNSQSEEALQALAKSPLRQSKPKEFAALFGYLLGNRDGIDSWRQIPARLKRGPHAAVKSGSGGAEKNIEVQINRRFKRQGRSWNPARAGRLLALRTLLADAKAWKRFWKQPPPHSLKSHPP